ncbi:MAG: ATP-binding protein [bacterium]
MFSIIQPSRLFRSVAFRLTLSYAVLFGLVSCAGVILIYLTIVMHLRSAVDEELINEMKELAYYAADHDLETVRQAFLLEAESEGPSNIVCRLISSTGEVLISSDISAWPLDELNTAYQPLPEDREAILKTISLKDKRGKARIISSEILPGKILQIGIATKEDVGFLEEFRRSAALIVTGMLILGALIGWGMARKAMVGVEKVTKAADRIARGHFDDRVDVTHYGEEIAQLGDTFNRMAERIQKLMTEMGEVNDNIAHDLRSPITRMRGLAETAITGKAGLRDYEEFAGKTVEECDLLLHMINTMLDISEAEAGLGRLDLEEVDVAEIICRATDLFQPVAEEKGIALTAEINPTPPIRGDLRKIQRTFANLIDNALKYTEPGGKVSVRSSCHNGMVRIVVQDTGVGISDQEKSRIFDRFYRGDHSRTQPGNGLGLSLALAVVRAHGGEITVESSPEEGTAFTLILPTVPTGEH